jgi:hypothetical protein
MQRVKRAHRIGQSDGLLRALRRGRAAREASDVHDRALEPDAETGEGWMTHDEYLKLFQLRKPDLSLAR